MGLNDTPRGERLHIALFGRRNAGKSSLINALTNQNIAIVVEHWSCPQVQYYFLPIYTRF